MFSRLFGKKQTPSEEESACFQLDVNAKWTLDQKDFEVEKLIVFVQKIVQEIEENDDDKDKKSTVVHYELSVTAQCKDKILYIKPTEIDLVKVLQRHNKRPRQIDQLIVTYTRDGRQNVLPAVDLSKLSAREEGKFNTWLRLATNLPVEPRTVQPEGYYYRRARLNSPEEEVKYQTTVEGDLIRETNENLYLGGFDELISVEIKVMENNNVKLYVDNGKEELNLITSSRLNFTQSEQKKISFLFEHTDYGLEAPILEVALDDGRFDEIMNHIRGFENWTQMEEQSADDMETFYKTHDIEEPVPEQPLEKPDEVPAADDDSPDVPELHAPGAPPQKCPEAPLQLPNAPPMGRPAGFKPIPEPEEQKVPEPVEAPPAPSSLPPQVTTVTASEIEEKAEECDFSNVTVMQDRPPLLKMSRVTVKLPSQEDAGAESPEADDLDNKSESLSIPKTPEYNRTGKTRDGRPVPDSFGFSPEVNDGVITNKQPRGLVKARRLQFQALIDAQKSQKKETSDSPRRLAETSDSTTDNIFALIWILPLLIILVFWFKRYFAAKNDSEDVDDNNNADDKDLNNMV